METTTTQKTFEFKLDAVHDWAQFIDLMLHYKDYPEELFGENQDGEMIGVSINRDNITIQTFQNNHWIRVDIYHLDGTHEELYDGRW